MGEQRIGFRMGDLRAKMWGIVEVGVNRSIFGSGHGDRFLVVALSLCLGYLLNLNE
jgi:hypothetical protein